jgi:hypothetical protein
VKEQVEERCQRHKPDAIGKGIPKIGDDLQAQAGLPIPDDSVSVSRPTSSRRMISLSAARLVSRPISDVSGTSKAPVRGDLSSVCRGGSWSV